MSGAEQGLLSVAFHPRYATNRLFYVNYTDNNGDTRVVEYRSDGRKAVRRVRQLLFVDQPYPNHNGGQLAFGPDGRLYVGMGDGGAGGDPENRAQNPASRLGKLLAINVNRRGAKWQMAPRSASAIPGGSRSTARPELSTWATSARARGRRSTTRRARAPASRTTAGTLRGACGVRAEVTGAWKLKQPIFVYDRDNGCSVTGGFVYRGAAVSSARGRYFFGDYCSGRVWSTKVVGGEARCAGRGDPRRRAVLVRRGRDRRALPDLARRLGLQARTLSPIRCRWVPEADPAYVAYHDDEWGAPPR